MPANTLVLGATSLSDREKSASSTALILFKYFTATVVDCYRLFTVPASSVHEITGGVSQHISLLFNH